MPKMKTRRAAAKRFKKTASGEFKHFKTSRATFSNINLLHVRETCVKQLWCTRLTKSM